MKLKLHHIGFVTGDISEYTRAFEALGLDQITEATPNPLQKVTASFVNVFPPADVHVELLESTDENSPITNFLKKRGGGLHHLCFEVDDIEEARARMEERGFRLVVPPEPCEAYDRNFKRECTGTSKAAFFLVGRLLLELLEKSAYSGRIRPLIPIQIVHSFRFNSSTRSGAIRPLLVRPVGAIAALDYPPCCG